MVLFVVTLFACLILSSEVFANNSPVGKTEISHAERAVSLPVIGIDLESKYLTNMDAKEEVARFRNPKRTKKLREGN